MKNEQIIESVSFGADKIEIVEMSALEGAQSGGAAEKLFFLQQSGASLKFVKITLAGGTLTTEAGAFYYSVGNIENNVDIGGIGGVAKKMFKNVLTQESAFNPTYKGKGVVYLEPTFKHYIPIKMDSQSFIVDKGLYYCSIGDIEVKPVMQSNISSALVGGEGFFQTKISGSGIAVLAIDVPMNEVQMYCLNNERMQVDGNFAILRESTVRFDVRKSAKGLIGSVVGGEGFLQTFEGTGQVWLTPTSPVYNKLSYGGVGAVNIQGNMHNRQ